MSKPRGGISHYTTETQGRPETRGHRMSTILGDGRVTIHVTPRLTDSGIVLITMREIDPAIRSEPSLDRVSIGFLNREGLRALRAALDEAEALIPLDVA